MCPNSLWRICLQYILIPLLQAIQYVDQVFCYLKQGSWRRGRRGSNHCYTTLIISVKQNSSKLTVFEITIPSPMSCANLANVAATMARLPVVCSCTFINVRSKSVRTSSSVMLLCVCGRLQRDGSTLSHTPDGLQVLLIMVVVLGQWRDWVVPAEVLGHKRKSMVSALQYGQPVPVGMLR